MLRLYTMLHGLCALLTKQVLYDSSTNPILSLHHWFGKAWRLWAYKSIYGSAGPSASKTKSHPLSSISTILGVSSYSEYISYNSSMGSSQFVTLTYIYTRKNTLGNSIKFFLTPILGFRFPSPQPHPYTKNSIPTRPPYTLWPGHPYISTYSTSTHQWSQQPQTSWIVGPSCKEDLPVS